MKTKPKVFPEFPARVLSDFTKDTPIYWFDGLNKNGPPSLDKYFVVGTVVLNDSKLAVIVHSYIQDNAELLVYPYDASPGDNWLHTDTTFARKVFVFSNPWFVTEKEMVWLSKAGKQKDCARKLIGPLRCVEGSEPNRMNFALAFEAWCTFWKKHKMVK